MGNWRWYHIVIALVTLPLTLVALCARLVCDAWMVGWDRGADVADHMRDGDA